jgi:hypothetical protein
MQRQTHDATPKAKWLPSRQFKPVGGRPRVALTDKRPAAAAGYRTARDTGADELGTGQFDVGLKLAVNRVHGASFQVAGERNIFVIASLGAPKKSKLFESKRFNLNAKKKVLRLCFSEVILYVEYSKTKER